MICIILAGVNLNNDRLRSQRLWVDLGGVLEEFGSQGALMTRVYFDVDSEDTATMIIDVKGPATVTGADIQCPAVGGAEYR